MHITMNQSRRAGMARGVARAVAATYWAATLRWAAAAHAQLKIEITSGVTDPIPMAIVPFGSTEAGDPATDVAAIVQHDLEGSGRFRGMPRTQMSVKPTRAADVQLGDWRASGNDYVVVGRVSPAQPGQLAVDFELLNALTGQQLANQRFVATPAAMRDAAHKVSDVIYEKILGVRGAFATRIAYVSVDGTPPRQRYQLIIADADGENPRVVLESQQPVMSPAWSPDGEWLAYVSFENKKSTIYVQQVRTGERRQVSARVGITGAPSWSPDGQKLALTLGGSNGNPDIYVLDLATQQLTRVTDDPSIDTEPAWTPDGRALYFTSDRAGGPQIYRIGLGPGERPRRITFGSTYSARPRVSPDGTQLAMVMLDQGSYRIAVQDIASGNLRVLSHGSLDESPSFAPNGAMIIYSGAEQSHRVLERVSVDALTGQRLKSEQADVREPVWAPFSR